MYLPQYHICLLFKRVYLTTACILSSQIPLYRVFLFFLLNLHNLHNLHILSNTKYILNKYLQNFKLILIALKKANLLYLVYRKLLFQF